MAVGYLPAPGTEFGPCPEPCDHTDCAASWADLTARCRICTEPIGADRGYFREGEYKEHRLVHATCALEEAGQ